MSGFRDARVPARVRAESIATLDAFVVAASFDRAGTTVAFALGDGTLRLVSLADRENLARGRSA